MKTEKAPQKKEKLPQKELRRDPAFRRELSRAWGVEEPPEAYRKALEETYTRLPDGPIARSRPLGWARFSSRSMKAGGRETAEKLTFFTMWNKKRSFSSCPWRITARS